MNLSERQKNILRFVGLKIASSLINVLLKTVRIRKINSDVISDLENKKQNFVIAFWHGSMLLGWYLHKDKNCSSLVSKSKDGDILNAILEKWNYRVVRGSSRDGGKAALELMLQLVNDGFSLAITPDGPTGPIHKMKAGAVIISQRCEVPLILAGIAIKNKWTLNSWDRFEIPKPFSKSVVVFSNPIMINKNFNYEETNSKIKEYELLLIELQKKAAEQC